MNTAVFENSTEESDGEADDLLEEAPGIGLDKNTEEKPRTLDFFDLPDEAYKTVEPTEEESGGNVADVEDLFGDLLIDDEPDEKKRSLILPKYSQCLIQMQVRMISINTMMRR